MEKQKCMVYPELQANVLVVYGLYDEFAKGRPHHELFLSDKAAKELWDKCSTLVNLGLCHWSNKPIVQ